MDEAPISVWEDPDVRRIFDVSSGQPLLDMSLLGPIDQFVMERFVEADMQAHMDSPATVFVNACLVGITTFDDGISDAAPIGFKKFIAYQVALNASIMWNQFRNARETSAIADWAVATFSAHGWRPDGIPGSAMGQRCRWTMALAAESGGGVRPDPRTGKFEVPNGDVARQAAAAGAF